MRLVASFALLAALASQARGEARPEAALGYARGAGAERCPGEDALRAAVAARLGYDPFREGAPTTLDVSVAAAPAGERGLFARIDRTDERGRAAGTRRVGTLAADGDCRELAELLALELALSIDPFRPQRPPKPPPPPATETAAPSAATAIHEAPAPSSSIETPAPAVAAPASATPAPFSAREYETPPIRRAKAEREPIGVWLGFGVIASIGSAPDLDAGFRLESGFRLRWFSLALELRGDIPAAVSTAVEHVETSLVFASLSPCARVGVFAGCALLSAGAQVGQSTSGLVTREVAAPYVAAGGRLALEIPWTVPSSGILSLLLHADVLASLTRDDLRVDGVVIARAPVVAGALGLALLVHVR